MGPIRPLLAPYVPSLPAHSACKAHTYARKGASGTKTNSIFRARPGTPGALPQTSRTAHHPCGRCVMFATAPHSVHARAPSIAAHEVASKASGTGYERCQGAMPGGGVCDIEELCTSIRGVPTDASKSTVPYSTPTWGAGSYLESAGDRARWRF